MKFSCNHAMALAVVSAAFSVAVTSCSKSNNSTSSAGISATVNGSSWANSFPVVGVYFAGGYDFDLVGTQIKGGDTTGFELILFSPITLNKAVAADTSQYVVSYLDGKTGTAYNGDYGNAHSLITVTSYDSTGLKISGTFTGVLYDISGSGDSLVVTNGKFNTSFQVQ